ncbi:MAG: methyltransferase domain-containing protein [Ignavibacteria bacterium]
MKKENKDPFYARYLVYLTRPFPDFDFSFIKPVRKKAVEHLFLKPGDRVVDAGCGSGGSFKYLLEKVGSTGEVVGVDISPATVINTNKRIVKNNWRNVIVIEANAQTVELNGKFDGLLMFAAPDVYASQNAFSNILPCLKENARVAFFGAKISKRRFGWILNGLLRVAFSKLSFPTGPQLEEKPWMIIEKHLTKLEVNEYFFGWMFLANGIVAPSKGPVK